MRSAILRIKVRLAGHSTRFLAGLLSLLLMAGSIPATAFAIEPAEAAAPLPRLSSSVGQADERHLVPGAPVVVHVQDLHGNPEAQHKLREIIRYYSDRYPGSPVLAEGAPRGKVDLSALRAIPGGIRGRTFEHMFARGLMGAAEYTALEEQSDRLYGIEDAGIYEQAVREFNRLRELRLSTAEERAEFQSSIADMARQELPGRLRKLMRYLSDEERGEKWYRGLPKTCAAWNVGFHRYPSLATYLRILELQRNVRAKKLERQTAQVLGALKGTLNYREYSVLAAARSPGELAAFLQPHLASLDPALRRSCRDLENWLVAQQLRQHLDLAALNEESARLVEELCTAAPRSQKERAVFDLARLSALMEDGLQARLTPVGYAQYIAGRDRLVSLLGSTGLAARFPAVDSLLRNGHIERYYRLNLQRDRIFSEAVRASLDETRSPAAIVVTGGFHRGLDEQLSAAGMGYVSVLPLVQTHTAGDRELYEHLMADRLQSGDLARSALNAVLNSVGIPAGKRAPLAATLYAMAEAKGAEGPVNAQAMALIVSQWAADADLPLDVRIEGDDCVVQREQATVRLEFKGGSIAGFTVVDTGEKNDLAAREKERCRQAMEAIKQYPSLAENEASLEAVYRFISEKYEGKVLPSGESFLEHYLGMASNVARWGGSVETVMAALCRGCTKAELDRLSIRYTGKTLIFKRLAKLKSLAADLPFPDGENIVSLEGEDALQNYLDMVIQKTGNYQVLLLLFAEKLQRMSGTDTTARRKQHFEEIVKVYAPLAERLGIPVPVMQNLKDEAFRIISLDPDAGYYGQYEFVKGEIQKQYGISYDELDAHLADIRRRLESDLITARLPCDIKMRTKSIYSIWEKAYSPRRAEITTIGDLTDIIGIILLSDRRDEVDAFVGRWLEADPRYRSITHKKSNVGLDLVRYDFLHSAPSQILLFNHSDYYRHQFGITGEAAPGEKFPVPHWMFKYGPRISIDGRVVSESVRFFDHEPVKQNFVCDEIPLEMDSPETNFIRLHRHLRSRRFAVEVSERNMLSVTALNLPKSFEWVAQSLVFAPAITRSLRPQKTTDLIVKLLESFGPYLDSRRISGSGGVIAKVAADENVQRLLVKGGMSLEEIDDLRDVLPAALVNDVRGVDLLRIYAADNSRPLRAAVAAACMHELLPRYARVTFVNLYDPALMPSSVVTPVGLYQMMGYIRKVFGNEVTVKLHDMQLMRGPQRIEKIAEDIIRTKPRIVGISMFMGSRSLMEQLVGELEKSLTPDNMPIIILGKNIPTIDPAGLLIKHARAISVLGEGEIALERWIRFFRGEQGLDDMVNSVFNYGTETRHTLRQRIENLDELGMPDWSRLPEFLERSGGQMDIEFGRGCPWASCTFCAVTQFWGGERRKWTHKSIDRLIEELKIAKQHGVDRVLFTDEEFMDNDPAHIELVTRLAQRIIDEKLDMKFYTNARSDSVYSPDMSPERRAMIGRQLEKLKEAGFNKLFMGIESGSPTQLRRYGKGVTPETQMEAIRILREKGFDIEFGFIMFDPLVTRQELRENCEFIRKADFFPHLNAARVYRGTPLEIMVKNYEKKSGRRLLGEFDEDALCYEVENYAEPDVEDILNYCLRYSSDDTEYYKFYYDLKRFIRFHAEQDTQGVVRELSGKVREFRELEMQLLEGLLEVPAEDMERVYRGVLEKRAGLIRDIMRLTESDGLFDDLRQKAHKALAESTETGGGDEQRPVLHELERLMHPVYEEPGNYRVLSAAA